MTLRVLIVEDEFLIALDLQDQIEVLGHRVTGVARDVESCKQAASRERPDLALMDLRLAGGSSGVQASRWLHDVLSVRCIFISGNLDDGTRQALAVVKPFAFLGKPILTHQLERALSDCSRELGKGAD
ncbi:response regulator [Cereibacter changlensis]|uniref:Response regulator n=1 Tax=Cereibacter changlensis TaxID=402884 RepID=A0A4U0Z052_9RHOB|nr:response regulator [Cereibacter changlensis]TKA95794.1 response regulator [Cereibacter changlensis]